LAQFYALALAVLKSIEERGMEVIRNSCERLVNQRKSGCRKQLV